MRPRSTTQSTQKTTPNLNHNPPFTPPPSPPLSPPIYTTHLHHHPHPLTVPLPHFSRLPIEPHRDYVLEFFLISGNHTQTSEWVAIDWGDTTGI